MSKPSSCQPPSTIIRDLVRRPLPERKPVGYQRTLPEDYDGESLSIFTGHCESNYMKLAYPCG